MEFNKKEAYKIYQENESLTEATKQWCEANNLVYEDKYMHRLKRYAKSEDDEDLEAETITETIQYINDNSEDTEAFMPSAWDAVNNKFYSIDEYCEKYNLDKTTVRSSKLVSHNAGHMVYNIAFNPTVFNVEGSGISEEFLEEMFNKHSKPISVGPILQPGKKDWFDRLIITDIHIGMSPEGGRNVTPLYNDSWTKVDINRCLRKTVEHVIAFKKSSVLYIDELGDFMDGLFGETTRKGHKLPQTMSDKEAFDFGMQFKLSLVDALAPHYEKIICNNIVEDNHAGVFGYFVSSSVKGMIESRYENVEYNIYDRFLNQYSVGKHTFVITHGKDSESLKFGFKPVLDPKQTEKIDQFCKEEKLYNGNFIEFSKGDSHQFMLDYTTSNDFDYFNYPAFSPPSNWVSINFKRSRSGIVFQNVCRDENMKVINPLFF
jgi:hypothetical protein